MTAVAAQTMAWQQRRRNHPGPLGTDGATNNGGSGEQPSGLPQVEVYLGGWVDLTAADRVRYQQGIQVTRGQPDENQKTNPATATFRLDNRDGAFSPRNPLGPYYGIIEKNTPCRISVQSGNTKSYRFYGEIASWPQDWDPTGNDAWVDIQAAGVLRRLGQGAKPLRSTLYLGLTSKIAQQVVAYWPCEDGAASSRLAVAVGAQPMLIVGTPTLSSDSSFACSASLPVMGNGTFSGVVPTYTVTGQTQVRFLLKIPAGSTNGQRICRIVTTGTARTFELVYDSGGALTLNAYNASGTLLQGTGPVAFNLDNETVRASVELTQTGANITAQMATVVPNAPNELSFSMTVTGATVGRVTHVMLAPDQGLTNAVMGHLSVQSIVTSLGDLGSQLNAWNTEHAGARIGRLLGDAGIAYEQTGGNSVPMGPQGIDTLLNLIQQCVDADNGILYELTDQVGIGYRTRDNLQNQAPGLTLDYSQAQLSAVPKPIDDDTFTRNDITVSRQNGNVTGSFVVAQQNSPPLSIAQPPAGVGDYQTQYQLNLPDDTTLADQAGWRLHLGTVAEPRYPQLVVQLARSEITSSTTLRPLSLGLNPGDRMVVVNPPPWLPPDPISAIVLGYQESFDQFLHQISWYTRPESPFRVATTDDPLLGHADTDGSTLAQSLSAPLTANAFFAGGSLTGWAAFRGTIAASQAVSGGPFAWSCLFTSNGVNGGAVEGTPASFGVYPGSVYQTSCWVYFPTGGNVDVGVDWLDGTMTYVSTSTTTVSVPAGVWTAIGSGSLTAPGGAVFAYPRCGPTTASNGLQLYVQGLLSWQGAVQVATTNPASPLWTTNAGDFPFDIAVGGERMTATGITGSTSPQTFTVARAANGVVKPQAQSSGVQLWQPAILEM